MGKIVQVVCWYSVWLRGAAGVGGEVSEETIQTYLYSNCTFFHQIEQRVQSSFTVHCTCFCQPAGKQDRIHARTNMVKTALRKLFAGILCGCLVLLVLLIGGQVNAGKKPSNHIQPYFSCTVEQARFRKKKALYRTFWSLSLSLSLNHILTAHLHNQNSQKDKQVRTVETLATIIYYTCWRQVDRFQYLFQQPEQNPYKKETLWKPHCVTQIGCWYSAWCCWCCAFFATSTQEESKQSVPFQPTTLREKNDDKICVRKALFP